MYELLTILFLVIAGNGAPILIRYFLGQRASLPVDFYRDFIDGKRLFGDSKTWVGLLSIPVASITMAWLLGLAIITGMLVGLGVMAGDLLSSFIKRRLGMKQSSMAIGLDQIPESLLPLILVKEIQYESFQFTWVELFFGVAIFIIFELLISKLLYWMHIRKQPY